MRNIHQLFLLLFLPFLIFTACNDKGVKEKQANKSENNTIQKEEDFRKTCNALLKSIQEKDSTSFNKFIRPRQGMYVLYRPGAFDEYSNIQKIEDDETVSFRFEVMEILEGQDLNVNMKYGELPIFDCWGPEDRNEDYWSKRGYFTDTINKYTPVSMVVADRKEYFEEDISEKERTAITFIEQNSRKVVFTGSTDEDYGCIGVTFYLMYADGQWWISILDWVFNDCGA